MVQVHFLTCSFSSLYNKYVHIGMLCADLFLSYHHRMYSDVFDFAVFVISCSILSVFV